jgi:CheY-like chemotaxis protein
MATILIVDDRPTDRELLVTLLGYAGHRMLEAADGVMALAVMRAERPDLIIADIIMPAMDGYELARQVRSDPAIGPTQIIFYTASYDVAEAHRLAEACGVTFFLPKPSEPQKILDTVNAALAARAVLPVASVPEEFYHEHMRLLTNTLARKVEDLEAEVAGRQQAQTALWQSEEKYRTLVETAEDVIVLTDLAGKQLLRNKAYYTSLGLTGSPSIAFSTRMAAGCIDCLAPA